MAGEGVNPQVMLSLLLLWLAAAVGKRKAGSTSLNAPRSQTPLPASLLIASGEKNGTARR